MRRKARTLFLAALVGAALCSCVARPAGPTSRPGAAPNAGPRERDAAKVPIPSPHLHELLGLLAENPGAVPDGLLDASTTVVQWSVPVTRDGPAGLPRQAVVSGASLDADRALDRTRTTRPHSWLFVIEPETRAILYWVPVSDPLLVRMEAFPTRETDAIRGRHRRVAKGAATVRFPFESGAILFWAAPDLPPRPVYEGSVYVLGKTPADPVGLAFRAVSRTKGKTP